MEDDIRIITTIVGAFCRSSGAVQYDLVPLSTHRTSSLYEIIKITKEGSSEIFSTDEERSFLSLRDLEWVLYYLPLSSITPRSNTLVTGGNVNTVICRFFWVRDTACFDREVMDCVHRQAIHVRVAGLLLRRFLGFLLWQQIRSNHEGWCTSLSAIFLDAEYKQRDTSQ